MPAVKSFALYAAMAVLMDFVLQMTAFVALLSLDARRQDSNRCELLCCVSVSTQRPNKPNEGFLLPFMRKYYAPALLHRCTRFIVVRLLIQKLFHMSAFRRTFNDKFSKLVKYLLNWLMIRYVLTWFFVQLTHLCAVFRCWFSSSCFVRPYSLC